MGERDGRRLSFDERGSLGLAGAVGLRVGGAAARVGVVFGGPSPEHDVSILTGLQAARALQGTAGIGEVHLLYWSKVAEWFELPAGLEAAAFVSGVPQGAQPLRLVTGAGGGFVGRKGRFAQKDEPLELDVVLNCCHGGPGEDGTLQGVLDLAGIPYSGPSVSGAALGMDKLAFGAMVASAWLPMLPRVPLSEQTPEPSFPGPYIVKPRFGGSSIGIEVVGDFATAKARLKANPHLRRGAVLEPYQPELYDLQVAVRVWPDLELSAIERPLRSRPGGEILGYQDKYVGGEGMASAPRECPASVSPELERQLRAAATEIAYLAGVRGVARIDFLSDGDALYVNEINTIPGSLARYLWVDPPRPFQSLLLDLLGEAIARPSTHFSVQGADGSVLRSAGTIASKLA